MSDHHPSCRCRVCWERGKWQDSRPYRDPLNLAIAVALAIIVPWALLIHCSPVQPAAKAPMDSGWRTVTVPADFDAGQP